MGNTFKGQDEFYSGIIQVGQSSIPASDLDVIIPAGDGHICACTRMGFRGGIGGVAVRVHTAATKGTGDFRSTLGIEANGVVLAAPTLICDFGVSPNVNRAANSVVAIGGHEVNKNKVIFSPELITVVYRITGTLGTGTHPQFQIIGLIQWKQNVPDNKFLG